MNFKTIKMSKLFNIISTRVIVERLVFDEYLHRNNGKKKDFFILVSTKLRFKILLRHK